MRPCPLRDEHTSPRVVRTVIGTAVYCPDCAVDFEGYPPQTAARREHEAIALWCSDEWRDEVWDEHACDCCRQYPCECRGPAEVVTDPEEARRRFDAEMGRLMAGVEDGGGL